MATETEKTNFIKSLFQLQQACNSKASDGGLTADQRNVFITAVIYLNSDIGKAWKRNFAPIPSDGIAFAISEVNIAASATVKAHDERTVQIAAKELWDANRAIDHVLPE